MFNFVFGGCVSSFGTLGVGLVGWASRQPLLADADRPLTGMSIFMVMQLTVGVLMVVSGVGYVMQSRFGGFVLGNLWALMALGFLLATTGFGAHLCVFCFYPVLTLILLNGPLKGGFVQP